jgi:redox-sensitive bicupin YhaK (pirin superfamily)
MSRVRMIRKIIKSIPTIEGAGVHLRRAFGFHEVPAFDPFLLLDDFRSHDPQQYIQGFPWHPHRGIETITYVLEGSVDHGDSLGNAGTIEAGDVQWMTAGSGIIHQEMPKGDGAGRMGGFQLWANLPAAHKMMAPRYREVKSHQIPEVSAPGGVTIRVICGNLYGTQGPVRDIVTDPTYLDVTVPAHARFAHPTPPAHTVFAYVIDGAMRVDPGEGAHDSPAATSETLVLFGDGTQVVMSTDNSPVRFLLVSGKPIEEPVAWRGPIVMNTQAELRTAFEEYRTGTFIKTGR